MRIEQVSRAPSWSVCLPSQGPAHNGPVFRHLNRKWVDAFFTTGELQLSSIAHFKKHPDELRRDAQEGVFISQSSIGLARLDGYVLSCTTKWREAVMSKFEDKRLLQAASVVGTPIGAHSAARIPAGAQLSA